MVEEFVGIIAATIIVMRPCFNFCYRTVTTAISTTSAANNDLTATRRSNSLPNTFSRPKHGYSNKASRYPFPSEREIELDSRNTSTEGILWDVVA